MNAKPFQVCVLEENVKMTLDLLNVFVLREKLWMKTMFVKMKMNVQPTIKAKKFVPMEDVSIEILVIFAFVIQDISLLKIKSHAWMQGKSYRYTYKIDFATNIMSIY